MEVADDPSKTWHLPKCEAVADSCVTVVLNACVWNSLADRCVGRVNRELLKIAHNAIRLGLTSAPILHLFWGVEQIIPDPPLWATIMLGALLGGCVFVPAKNIGDSIWAVITTYVETILGKPQSGEQDYHRRIDEYEKWQCEIRSASLVQVGRRMTGPAFRGSMIVSAVLALLFLVLIAVASVQEGITVQAVAGSIAVSLYLWGFFFFVLLVTLLIMLSLLLKLYYNEHDVPE